MSSKDTKTKQYTKDPRIFADAFNRYLYHGREVIKAQDLREMDAAEVICIDGDAKTVLTKQKYRDIKKSWIFKNDGRNVYCLLAVENQSDIHYAMPLKAALYDAMQLEEQRRIIEARRRQIMRRQSGAEENVGGNGSILSKAEFLSGFGREDRLIPVVTLVIYYGADEWDAPRCLREMYAECDETILKHTMDYQINLIAPYHMSDEDLAQFHTSLRQVMTYIKYSKDKTKLMRCMEQDENFLALERDAAEVIREMTNARFSVDEGKERVNMCLAEEQMIEEGRAEGRAEYALSFVECIENAIKTFHLTLKEACEALGTTVSRYEESKKLLEDRK